MSSAGHEGRLPEASVRELLAWVDEQPTISRYVSAARRWDRIASAHPEAFVRRFVVVIRNFTIEPLEPFLKLAGAKVGMELAVTYSSYDVSVDEIQSLLAAKPDVVIVSLRLEDLVPSITENFLATTASELDETVGLTIERMMQLVDAVHARSDAAVFVHNFVAPIWPAGGLGDGQDPHGQLNTVRRLNLELASAVRGADGAYLVDVDHLFAGIGLRHCFDERGARVGGAPLAQPALRSLAEMQARHIKALSGTQAKCIVVDCDGTLWGGVVGEDGIGGIALGDTGEGRRFRDFQQELLNLRRRGVLLAIASKNEEADVLDVLCKHPYSVLSETDFAARRINWDDKATNIESLAAELGLGLEHLVFVDDNPVECEWVEARLPAVRVVRWPSPSADVRRLDDLGLFDSLVMTNEDRARTEMYRAEAQRRVARAEAISLEEYLRSLGMVVTMGLASDEHLGRLAQLTQRTNQFNLTTERYDIASLEGLRADSDVRVAWLGLRDRFGDHGIVGCGVLRRRGDAADIEVLLLSCRVLGRQVETVLVRMLASLARVMGCSTLVGHYVPSARNAQVADLYGQLGFDGPKAGEDRQTWTWSLSGGDPPSADWFQIVEV